MGSEGAKKLDESTASETRGARRRKVYLGELSEVDLAFDAGEFKADIVDLSPAGMGVVCKTNPALHPVRGQKVHAAYSTRGGKRFRNWGVVAAVQQIEIRGQQLTRIGIAFTKDEKIEVEEKLLRDYLACPAHCRPQAWAEDPFFFRERIHFQIVSFCPAGLILHCSNTHETLLPNVVLSLNVFLPMLGQFSADVCISRVTGAVDSSYQVEATFVGDSKVIRCAVTEYLLLSGAVSNIESLRDRFFAVGPLDKALRFYYAISDQDYAEIVRMRGGEHDRLDNYSRFLMCRVGEHNVACSRIVFTDGDTGKSEFEALLHEIPQKFWVQKFIEVSRFHCEPGFEARDVYLSFLRHFVRIAAESGCRYVLSACSARTLRLYERLGFRKLGEIVSIDSDNQEGKTVVVSLDVHKILTVNGLVTNEVWHKLYADVSKHVGMGTRNGEQGQLLWTRRSYI